MKFRKLQENLRDALWKRIDSGDLTGLRLAEQTGFKQAHISNFLNRRRGLSLAGMDQVLDVQHLSVLDLIDPAEINKRASILPPSDDEFDNVVVADMNVAAFEPLIMNMHVQQILKFTKSFLRHLRKEVTGKQRNWERFVAIKADTQEGMSMHPRIAPGAFLLLDRHYNSLTPYRKGATNIYAVRKDGFCTIKYVESDGRHIVLRPHNLEFPSEIVRLSDGQKPTDHIVGRVCHIGIQT
jgi:Peptidase S24-like